MSTQSHDLEVHQQAVTAFREVRAGLHQVVVGMEPVIDALSWTLLARGHALFIGVPGLAKTLLISTLSELMGLHFNRIQFTPDMMPSDLIGSEILEENKQTGKREFQFRQGPLFCQMLLADEVNRTPPKTQSALLQAMQEGRVTYTGKTYDLVKPFVVFATQNPVESEGTYPLPEAQLDRFLLAIPVHYPSFQDEREIVRRTTSPQSIQLKPVMTAEDLMSYQDLVRKVPLEDRILDLIVSISRASRPGGEGSQDLAESIRYGAGPRASQAMALASKARAFLEGRFAVREEDVLAVAPYVLKHRMVLRKLRDQSPDQIVEKVVQSGYANR
jgi:MoxR-like ATPase